MTSPCTSSADSPENSGTHADARYYLSAADLRDRLHDQGVLDDSTWTSDCGGWTWDPPCGGCDRCIAAQVRYYFDQEVAKVRRYQRAGFEVADPIVVDLDHLRSLGLKEGVYSMTNWLSIDVREWALLGRIARELDHQ